MPHVGNTEAERRCVCACILLLVLVACDVNLAVQSEEVCKVRMALWDRKLLEHFVDFAAGRLFPGGPLFSKLQTNPTLGKFLQSLSALFFEDQMI